MPLILRKNLGKKQLSFEQLDGNFEYFTGSHAVTGSFITSGSSTTVGSLITTGSLLIKGNSEFSGNAVLKSGSLIVYPNGLSAGSSSLSSSWTATSGGTQTSGSAGVTGSVDVTGSSTVIGVSNVTGSSNTIGSSTTTGTSTVVGTSTTSGSSIIIGNSFITGDLDLNGCLSIMCCDDILYNGFECKVVEILNGGLGFIARVNNAYGSNVTDTLEEAIIVGSGSLYFYSPNGGELATYPIVGTNFTDVPDSWNYTYITASGAISGTNIILESTVIVGQPGSELDPPSGGFKQPLIPVEDCYSIAEFCCDGAIIDVDVNISGGLGVTGSVDVTGSVTVNGCVEVITSASCDQVLFTGFNASFRSSFLSGSVFLTSLYVTTPPYGDITAEFESYANANGGIVTLYNSETSEIIYVNYLSSYYNGFANVLQFTGNQEVIPDSTGYLAIGINGTSPIGADVTVTVPGECFSTVIICDEEVTINGDTAVSGSVSVTGSVTVSDPCPDIIGFDVFIKSSQELTPGVYTSQIILGPQYGNIQSIIVASAASNGNKLRIVNSNLSFNRLCTFVSYNPVGVGSIFVESTTPIPTLQPYILADAGYVNLPSPADAIYVNAEACGTSAITINTDVTEISSDVNLQKSLILGPNNQAFDNTTSNIEEFQYVGYNGTVIVSGSGEIFLLDAKYGDVTSYLTATEEFYFSFYSPDYNEVVSIPIEGKIFDGVNTYLYSSGRTAFDKYVDLELVVGTYTRTLVEADTAVYLNSYDQALIVGANNYNNSKGALLVGEGLTSIMDYGTVLGTYNLNPEFSPSIQTPNSLLVVGNGTISTPSNAFEVTTSGSITIPTTQSAAPSWTGKDGEMVFATVTGDHFFYVWMAGSWRSGSLA